MAPGENEEKPLTPIHPVGHDGGGINIDELVTGVTHALFACSFPLTHTPTPTTAPHPTATPPSHDGPKGSLHLDGLT